MRDVEEGGFWAARKVLNIAGVDEGVWYHFHGQLRGSMQWY